MLTLLTLGCFLRAPSNVEVAEGPGLPEGEARIGLAPAVFYQDALQGDLFEQGAFIGDIKMSGGYVIDDTAAQGLQTRSKEYAFGSAEMYRETAAAFLDGALSAELTEEARAWQRVGPVAVDTYVYRAFRGTHEADGTDNVNLPRFELEPANIAPVSGVDVVLVPTVVVYYSHNGGWFVGHHYGCSAGARFRVLLSAYDATTGSPIAWYDVQVRSLEEKLQTPSSAQAEDSLIAVEQMLADELARFIR